MELLYEKYYTYIKDEVFNTCRNLFNLTHDPEKTMVAGLSMGGYGALKIGLNNFDVFRHIGSFSPCPLLDYVRDGFEERINKLFGSFDNFKGSISDIRYVTSNISKCDMPNLYLYCGCNDFLYEMNLEYIKILEENELKFHFETDLGDHSWPYWNKHVRKFLESQRERSNKQNSERKCGGWQTILISPTQWNSFSKCCQVMTDNHKFRISSICLLPRIPTPPPPLPPKTQIH